jgi:hypothetical protein
VEGSNTDARRAVDEEPEPPSAPSPSPSASNPPAPTTGRSAGRAVPDAAADADPILEEPDDGDSDGEGDGEDGGEATRYDSDGDEVEPEPSISGGALHRALSSEEPITAAAATAAIISDMRAYLLHFAAYLRRRVKPWSKYPLVIASYWDPHDGIKNLKADFDRWDKGRSRGNEVINEEEQEWIPTEDVRKYMEFRCFAMNLLTCTAQSIRKDEKENQKFEAARERIKKGDKNTTLTISVIPHDDNKDGGMVYMNFDSQNTSEMFSHMQLTTQTEFQETNKKEKEFEDLCDKFAEMGEHVPTFLMTALNSIKGIEKLQTHGILTQDGEVHGGFFDQMQKDENVTNDVIKTRIDTTMKLLWAMVSSNFGKFSIDASETNVKGAQGKMQQMQASLINNIRLNVSDEDALLFAKERIELIFDTVQKEATNKYNKDWGKIPDNQEQDQSKYMTLVKNINHTMSVISRWLMTEKNMSNQHSNGNDDDVKYISVADICMQFQQVRSFVLNQLLPDEKKSKLHNNALTIGSGHASSDRYVSDVRPSRKEKSNTALVTKATAPRSLLTSLMHMVDQ